MKRLLLPLLVFALLSAFAVSASAGWDTDNGIYTETDPATVKTILDFTESLPWIADGADTGKYLYVIADAGCSASKQLYTMSRDYTKTMQIRWIFVDGEAQGTYNSLYENLTPETLRAAFMDQTLPDDKDPKKSAKIEQYTLKGVFLMLVRRILAPAPDEFAFPTMIYGDAKKVTINVGLDPSDLGNIIASLPTVPVKSGFVPLALTADQDAYPLKPVPAGYKYTNNNADNATLYMLPDQTGPCLGTVAPKIAWPFPCVGVTEDGFIATRVFEPKDGRLYLYDPAEVKRILGKN